MQWTKKDLEDVTITYLAKRNVYLVTHHIEFLLRSFGLRPLIRPWNEHQHINGDCVIIIGRNLIKTVTESWWITVNINAKKGGVRRTMTTYFKPIYNTYADAIELLLNKSRVVFIYGEGGSYLSPHYEVNGDADAAYMQYRNRGAAILADKTLHVFKRYYDKVLHAVAKL